MVFPFSECHTVGIMYYVAFSDGFLSPSNVHLKFVPVFSWLITHFFLVLNTIPLSGCTTVYFIHSPTGRPHGCFQVLLIPNALNIGVHGFVWT